MKMSKNNIIYILVIVILYMVLNLTVFHGTALFQMMIIEVALLIVALSPIGEAFLRLVYGVKSVQRRKDKEYLLPIFEEVTGNNTKIKLYIDKSMMINAYAIGRNTIVVTKGSIEILRENQIKGLIAHELGHIIHGDTLIPLILIVGNMFMLIAFIAIKMIEIIMAITDNIMNENNIISSIIKIILDIGMFLVVQLIQILVLINQRQNEYKADDFAYTLGYGDDLLEVLYILDSIDLGGKVSVIDRLKSSHPHVGERIQRLEEKK